jgi:hypothetical protein
VSGRRTTGGLFCLGVCLGSLLAALPFTTAAQAFTFPADVEFGAKSKKKKALMVGVGLDSDGHKRVTTRR